MQRITCLNLTAVKSKVAPSPRASSLYTHQAQPPNNLPSQTTVTWLEAGWHNTLLVLLFSYSAKITRQVWAKRATGASRLIRKSNSKFFWMKWMPMWFPWLQIFQEFGLSGLSAFGLSGSSWTWCVRHGKAPFTLAWFFPRSQNFFLASVNTFDVSWWIFFKSYLFSVCDLAAEKVEFQLVLNFSPREKSTQVWIGLKEKGCGQGRGGEPFLSQWKCGDGGQFNPHWCEHKEDWFRLWVTGPNSGFWSRGWEIQRSQVWTQSDITSWFLPFPVDEGTMDLKNQVRCQTSARNSCMFSWRVCLPHTSPVPTLSTPR